MEGGGSEINELRGSRIQIGGDKQRCTGLRDSGTWGGSKFGDRNCVMYSELEA